MSEIRPIVMPRWGLTMQEGLVARWLVEEGALVEAGQDLLEIETTKIANVLESTRSGRLRRRVAGEGETLPVGALLGVLADDAAPDAALDAYIAEFRATFETSREETHDRAPEPGFIEAGGRRIRYLELGEGEGPPVVLIHGFGGDLTNWQYNQETLGARHRTVALDLPGHGGSTKDVGRGDVEALAASVLAFLGALGVETAHLVGHSLGGAVALQVMADAPRRVASLALISPLGFGPEISSDYLEGFMAARRRKQMKPVLEMLFADPGMVGREMVEAVLRYRRLDGVDQALRTIADAISERGRQRIDQRPLLDAAGRPVLLIWGREDDVIPANHAAQLPAGVERHLIDQAGHMAHLEQAETVNELLRRHFARA